MRKEMMLIGDDEGNTRRLQMKKITTASLRRFEMLKA